MAISSRQLIGSLLGGRFQIKDLIGAGAIGSVYLAEDLKTKRSVALKVLRSTTRDALRKFRYEAETATKLEHPNIPEVLLLGLGQYPWFYAMEYVRGYSLKGYQTRYGPVPPYRDSFFIAGELLLAMDYAHGQGISHNDLKPENVLVEFDKGGVVQGVKLIDFGLAQPVKWKSAASDGATLAATIYQAPERLLGMPGGPITDYYSFGVILGELVTGHQPWGDDPDGDPTADEPKTELSGDVPKEFVPLLSKLLSLNPTKRPSNGAEIGRDLSAAFGKVISSNKARVRKEQEAATEGAGKDTKRVILRPGNGNPNRAGTRR